MVYRVVNRTLYFTGIAVEWFLYRVLHHDKNRIIYALIGKHLYHVEFLYGTTSDIQKTIILATDEYEVASFLRKKLGPIEFKCVDYMGPVEDAKMWELAEMIKGAQS